MTYQELNWARGHDWYAGHIEVGEQITIICAFKIGARVAIETYDTFRALRIAAGY